MFRIVHRPETETDDAEGVPDASIPGRPTERLFETRARERVLAPGRRSKAPLPRTPGILRRDLGGWVVKVERLVVPVGKLERVTEFDPRHRTFRSEPLGKARCFFARCAEVARDTVNADEKPPRLVILG